MTYLLGLLALLVVSFVVGHFATREDARRYHSILHRTAGGAMALSAIAFVIALFAIGFGAAFLILRACWVAIR